MSVLYVIQDMLNWKYQSKMAARHIEFILFNYGLRLF